MNGWPKESKHISNRMSPRGSYVIVWHIDPPRFVAGLTSENGILYTDVPAEALRFERISAALGMLQEYCRANPEGTYNPGLTIGRVRLVQPKPPLPMIEFEGLVE